MLSALSHHNHSTSGARHSPDPSVDQDRPPAHNPPTRERSAPLPSALHCLFCRQFSVTSLRYRSPVVPRSSSALQLPLSGSPFSFLCQPPPRTASAPGRTPLTPIYQSTIRALVHAVISRLKRAHSCVWRDCHFVPLKLRSLP